jgi:hypothetical protein
MIPDEQRAHRRGALRRDLIRRYVHLQHELIDADPMSSAYQATIHAFRQMGYTLITSGFEDDLDRLLRLRVLDGGRGQPAPRGSRRKSSDLLLVERREL